MRLHLDLLCSECKFDHSDESTYQAKSHEDSETVDMMLVKTAIRLEMETLTDKMMSYF